jgi:hypothetical protein
MVKCRDESLTRRERPHSLRPALRRRPWASLHGLPTLAVLRLQPKTDAGRTSLLYRFMSFSCKALPHGFGLQQHVSNPLDC